MRGIELKNGCIIYYGNPSGYVEDGTAIVDSMFQNEEFSKWLGNRKLTAKWTEGVFERLSKEGVLLINNERPVPLKDCRIWQLRADISAECKFIGYEELKENFGEPDKNNYELVYEGEIETNDLESIYSKFNLNHPRGFTGHSLSMSDVVELYDDNGSEFYYVDRFGFKEIDFANFIGKYAYTADKVILTDMCDRLIVESIYGGFIMNCPNQELCRNTISYLAPIQQCEIEPKDFPVATRDEM